jgi:hypothetical protein
MKENFAYLKVWVKNMAAHAKSNAHVSRKVRVWEDSLSFSSNVNPTYFCGNEFSIPLIIGDVGYFKKPCVLNKFVETMSRFQVQSKYFQWLY